MGSWPRSAPPGNRVPAQGGVRAEPAAGDDLDLAALDVEHRADDHRRTFTRSLNTSGRRLTSVSTHLVLLVVDRAPAEPLRLHLPRPAADLRPWPHGPGLAAAKRELLTGCGEEDALARRVREHVDGMADDVVEADEEGAIGAREPSHAPIVPPVEKKCCPPILSTDHPCDLPPSAGRRQARGMHHRSADLPVIRLEPGEDTALARAVEAGVYATHLLAEHGPDSRLERAAEAGRQASDRLWWAGSRIAAHLAHQVATTQRLPVDDLLQDAYVALTESVLRYDHARGMRFSSFVYQSVTQALVEAYRRGQARSRRREATAGRPASRTSAAASRSSGRPSRLPRRRGPSASRRPPPPAAR